MKGEWIKVDGIHQVPVGSWLVTTEGFGREPKKIHICNKDDTIAIVGGHFDFDMPDVIAYMPCPQPFDE